jgi:hypothetical protein
MMIEATVYYPDGTSETFVQGEKSVRRLFVQPDGTFTVQDGSTYFIEFHGLPFSAKFDMTV